MDLSEELLVAADFDEAHFEVEEVFLAEDEDEADFLEVEVHPVEDEEVINTLKREARASLFVLNFFVTKAC